MQKEGGFDAICAWGASKNEMTKILSNIDFDFNKYIFFTGKEINLELKGKLRKVPCKGLVIILYSKSAPVSTSDPKS